MEWITWVLIVIAQIVVVGASIFSSKDMPPKILTEEGEWE